jgi:hypothetical protein
MIILRRPVSSVLASRPVLAGSNGTFSRTILSAAFLLEAPVLLSAPLHKFSGNPSAISLDAPKLVAILTAGYLFGLDGLTSTLLIKVLSGIFINVRTISAISSEWIFQSDPESALCPENSVATLPGMI